MNGVKRTIAAVIAAIAAGLESTTDPFALLLAQLLRAIAALLGVVGVTQAATISMPSLKRYVLSTLAVIITIIHYIPALSPYEAFLRDLQVILAAGAVGQKIGEAKSATPIS